MNRIKRNFFISQKLSILTKIIIMKKIYLFFALMMATLFCAQAQKKVYTVFENGTLTYYYDDQMDYRSGTKEVYDPVNDPYANRLDGYNLDVLKAVVDASLEEWEPTSLYRMFSSYNYSLINLASIEGLEHLNTTNVTTMEAMFYNCRALTTLDLSSFDASNVQVTWAMFMYCQNLTTIYCNYDFTQNDMDYMASCQMFESCYKLVGGQGTAHEDMTYNQDAVDYARPDEGPDSDAPGYFSKKEATGIESNQPSVVSSQKILRDGQVLIQRDEKVYTVTGVEVK